LIFDAKPAIVGHRGFGAGEPGGYRENSVESFLAAARSGLPWVELDARRSRDGELVLWHDPVTPAGLPVISLTADELAAAGIVRLAEVLTALPATVSVDIDVKTIIEDATDAQPRRTHALIAAALREFKETRQFLVSSFDPSLPVYLAERKAETGDVALGWITDQDYSAGHAVSGAANLRLNAVCVHTGTLRTYPRRVLDFAHRSGLEVMAWSPEPAEALQLARYGIDAVCVNDIPGT
jgi:glycerophosphoryl diester phosphodiesterase